jgi:2-keto-3-deoxy-L-fuconate dehydrogenase
MAGRLKGKIAVVTAAGQGIGRAIAELFVAEGATVYASDIQRDKLDGLARAKKAKLDVLSTRAVEAYAAKVGEIDILVNVAGYVHHGTVLTTTDKDWDFSFDLNVKSMHRTIKAFLPGMLARAKAGGKTSSIVNVASGASSIRGIPNRYAYGASKAAVIGLTKAVAADYIRDGVRCNAIAPGTFKSPSWEDRVETLGKEWGSKDKAMEMFVQRQPMGRVGDAIEIAPVVVYLASDEAAFTTGTVINAVIAAAIIFFGFGIVAFLMPKIMLAVGAYSTIAAGAIAIAFVAAFFLVFWLRGRSRKGG